nr:major capsid protein [Rattus norvegicus microvirus]
MRKRNSKFTFGSRPLLYHSRSQFDLSFHHKTTMNAADLVPIYCQEISPGDTFKCDMTAVVRTTSAMLKPVMDNMFMDVYFFWCPNRLSYDRWKEVMGENKKNAWAQSDDVLVPTRRLNLNENSDYRGTLADYFGLPVTSGSGSIPLNVSDLPIRDYALIYDEWFRDENNIDPMNINIGDVPDGTVAMFNTEAWSPQNYAGRPAKIAKVHDYFTSCLPSPQKGNPVSIGTAILPPTSAPVVTTSVFHGGNSGGLALVGGNDEALPSSVQGKPLFTQYFVSPGTFARATSSDKYTYDTSVESFSVAPANLWANIPETSLGAVSVNELRYAFQLQKLLEKDARGGTRYAEILKEHYGVTTPDSVLQRPEYLGGKRIPLNVYQTVQTSKTDGNNPLGDLGAFSLSSGRAGYTKGFTEHGFVIGLAAIRQFHTYNQGLERFWRRKKRTDFYDPVFANIGEQPVFKEELFVSADNSIPNSDGSLPVFGYNEAWADYRYRPSHCTGHMRPTGGTDIGDIWTFADEYSTSPVLGKEFIEETSAFIDRTLAVPQSTAPQFMVDIYFKNIAIRELPTYSIPGLIDHH